MSPFQGEIGMCLSSALSSPKVAHRFNGGFDAPFSSSPVRDDSDAECCETVRSCLTGLNVISFDLPTVKTVGYFQKSLASKQIRKL